MGNSSSKKHVGGLILGSPTDMYLGNASRTLRPELTSHMGILATSATILLGLWVVETVAFCVSYRQSAKGSATEIETNL